MKRLFCILMIGLLALSNAMAELPLAIEIFGNSSNKNVQLNSMLERILLNDKYDKTKLLNPDILSSFAGYATRKAIDFKSSALLNKKLILLLELLKNNVKDLKNTEAYVHEIRIILYDSINSFAIAKALDLYGSIMDVNPPTQSDVTGVSTFMVFHDDVSKVLARLTLRAHSDTQTIYIMDIAIPYLTKTINSDPKIIQNKAYLSRMLLLSNIHRSVYVNNLLTDYLFATISFAGATTN